MDNYDWLHTEQTQKLVKGLKENRAELTDLIGHGTTISETTDKTAQLTAKFVGYIKAYTDILDAINSFNTIEESGDTIDA